MESDDSNRALSTQVLEPGLPQVMPVDFEFHRGVMMTSDPRGTTAEAIRALRTHLIARHLRGGRRGMVVCEAEQSGAIFVAVNLAVAFAEAGIRTLIIDADLRRSPVAELIQPSRQVVGLADVIGQPAVSIGSAIHQVSPNLSIIFAGDSAGRDSDMLSHPRFAQICDLCMRDFEVTITTSPAANYYADARRIASLMRHVLIVARRDVTFVNDVKALIQELSSDGAEIVGTVYNDF